MLTLGVVAETRQEDLVVRHDHASEGELVFGLDESLRRGPRAPAVDRTSHQDRRSKVGSTTGQFIRRRDKPKLAVRKENIAAGLDIGAAPDHTTLEPRSATVHRPKLMHLGRCDLGIFELVGQQHRSPAEVDASSVFEMPAAAAADHLLCGRPAGPPITGSVDPKRVDRVIEVLGAIDVGCK